jgi:hypothetical protein
MTNVNTEGLPPQMQERIAQIIEQAKANVVQSAAPAAPTQPGPVAAQGLVNPGALAPRGPSLMDHIIALRQEVADLRQQVHASSQVTEAVGNAVGSLYQMFHEQTEVTNFSGHFQEAPPSQVDDY